jgi:hypothetical protein
VIPRAYVSDAAIINLPVRDLPQISDEDWERLPESNKGLAPIVPLRPGNPDPTPKVTDLPDPRRHPSAASLER